ncbi:hypothetical protein HELRODRAFT_169987 [Helobdella robusta]|uniref:Dolichyl-diphosphooligosaccharide--protein glycosyltransferase subunit 1 n=1 Tax=Helobdella robusta TaxID=6412 RepID=T1F2I0_HELRO|nr:hypothetical protein HELRODRAFT_169987 [Helobdella robusta]ESO08246.1 hypothetical protein HELRODRAFT_169987 [Helobdella robusta]
MTCVLAISLFSFVLCAVHGASYSVNQDIKNVNVVRKVDLTSHLVKTSAQVTFVNNGKSPVNSYLVSVEPKYNSKLAFIGASISKSKDDFEKLSVTEVSVEKQSNSYYLVHLNKNVVEPGFELTIIIETIFIHALLPYPSHITQSEKQFVKYMGNLYFFTSYVTTTQTTIVTCSSSNIDSYTKEKPYNINDRVLNYGPYENIEPYSQIALSVHFENNTPFLTVTKMTRVIEVSHWGNIAVEETFDISHTGAILKGSFSRHDYQRNQDGVSSVKSFKTLLPASARDVYYRDEIGNISTSSLRESEDGLELELKPRFPLFGGWKTQHYIGYNVPSYQYLYNKGDKFALVMKLVDHIFDDQVVDDFTLKIILPEGVKDIVLQTPYEVNRESDELHATYLDTTGRPVIIVTKGQLVEQHIQDFQLHYTFSKYLLLREPLLVFAAFFILFLTVIVYVRLDFSITKDEASELKLRMASLVKQTVDSHERRSSLYQSYEDAINKYKASKEAGTFKNNQKKIDGDHKQLTQQIAAFQLKLKAEGSDAAEKVLELQRLDVQVRDQISLLITNAEKLINGRLQKQQYSEIDKGIHEKKDDLCRKMDAIIASL